jgi:putative transposase
VHYGLVAETIERRALVLDAAFLAHPERFPRGRPAPATPPNEAWIKKPNPEVEADHLTQ